MVMGLKSGTDCVCEFLLFFFPALQYIPCVFFPFLFRFSRFLLFFGFVAPASSNLNSFDKKRIHILVSTELFQFLFLVCFSRGDGEVEEQNVGRPKKGGLVDIMMVVIFLVACS